MHQKLRLIALATTALTIAALAHEAGTGPTNIEANNAKADGQSLPPTLSPELTGEVVAEGKMTLENPTELIGFYGYDNNGPMSPAAGDVQSKDHNVEATKTEPDKNTYLVLEGQTGPDANYNYGTHFLFQGHENGVTKDDKPMGYFTRVNLDADEAHRVTLMADHDSSGNGLVFIDGSTWNPFAKRLLLTGEEGDEGGLWQATASFPSQVDDLRGLAGIGSFEGVQTDKNGTIWLVEDLGGKKGEVSKHSRQPNSFVYRVIPTDKTDLTKGGKLEVLQVMAASGEPIVFNDGKVEEDITSDAVKAEYSYATPLKTKWIVIHDTAADGMTPFDANKLAKAKGGTPFKRPENGMFRPGVEFTEFYFTTTGDTDARSEVGAAGGAFGGIHKLVQADPAADEGTLSLVFLADKDHGAFDNLAFWSKDNLAVVEDAGDALHSQRGTFDAGYVIKVTTDYGAADAPKIVRFLANGRDEPSTVDSALLAVDGNGFQNDGDNEITGIHISDGDASEGGLLGAKVPTPFEDGWRVFYTQQHGLNRTYEIKHNATM